MHVCGHFGRETGLARIWRWPAAWRSTAPPTASWCARDLFDEVYVQPVAGDDGVALGAALYRTSLAQEIPNRRLPAPLFGPALHGTRS